MLLLKTILFWIYKLVYWNADGHVRFLVTVQYTVGGDSESFR